MEEERNLNEEETIANIVQNSRVKEELLASQLSIVDSHGPTIGTLRETIWQDMFEQIIPKKFIIEHSVFIIDSDGAISHEVDLAIMDEMYTPYIFRYGKMKFVPIEAVAVVVECKSSSQNKKDLQKWSEAIDRLRTNSISTTRIAPKISFEAPQTQKSTRPIKILCRLNNSSKEVMSNFFDCIISVVNNKLDVCFNQKNLFQWFEELNFHGEKYKQPKVNKVKDIRLEALVEWYEEVHGTQLVNEEVTLPQESDKERLAAKKLSDYEIPNNSLLSLNFQLNQLLMLINNPMPFPHLAYANMFKKFINEKEKKEEKK